MFTVAHMNAAHGKVKSGADFPRYIQEIKQLGLVSYDFDVRNGVTSYKGKDDYVVKSDVKYPDVEISATSSAPDVKHTISIHQQGQTDFPTFIRQVAAAGCEKWVVDTTKMMCTYYDLNGGELVAEPIPDASEY